jgi:GTP cyclohydrolase I
MNGSDDPIRGLVGSLLKELGEDPGREGLERTPERVARSLRYLTQGYELDPAAILSSTDVATSRTFRTATSSDFRRSRAWWSFSRAASRSRRG